MAANPRIRKALFEKLGLTQPGFSRHIKRFRQRLPMSYEDAIYVLAHINGVDIGRDLDPDTLSRVAGYVSELKTTPTASPKQATIRKPSTRPVLIQIAGIDVGAVTGMTKAHAQEAQVMAQKVYPILYVFENSARDLISRVLTKSIWKGLVGQDRP